MKHSILFIILLAFQQALGAGLYQPQQDSTLHVSVISSHSAFEKNTLHRLITNHKEDYFALFTALSADADSMAYVRYYKEYQDLIASLRTEIAAKKDEKQKIKSIYKAVHKTWLKKYEEQNEFSHIFTKGAYNCVSATAMYAMVLQDLGIPYAIKEAPTHVYLLAYPQTKRILLESTDPNRGFFEFSAEFKNRYVSHLKEGKLISAQEFGQHSVDALFDKYYFTDGTITLRQLAGIQYSNQGITNLNADDAEAALKALEKSYVLYPYQRTAYLLKVATSIVLSKGNYSKPNEIELLAKAAQYKAYGLEPEVIKGEFGRINDRFLINNYNPVIYDSLYHQLNRSIIDDELRAEIGMLYNYERGRVLYNKGEYKASLPFMEKALQHKSEHVDVQSLFLVILSKNLERQNNQQEIAKSLQGYSSKYSFLNKHTLFNTYLLHTYLVIIGQEYEFNRAANAEKWRATFETAHKEREEVSLDPNIIGRAYSMGAVYYFKQGNTTKARSVLNRGLEISPGNYELTTRMQMIR
jgi:hypothetical protein